MGFFSAEGDEHVESIVFFLSDALRSAIEAGDRLQQSVCDTPHFTPGVNAGEIADRLAGFRRQTGELWGLEALVLTKILRAGDLARELRVHEPSLKPEIDTFRLATVIAGDLRDKLMPDAESTFNGSDDPRCFLQARGQADFDGHASHDEPDAYKIAGEVDVRLLMDACEALHFALASRYGINGSALTIDAEAQQPQAQLSEGTADQPFLLSDWGEIIADGPSAPGMDWQKAAPQGQAVRH